MHVLKIISDMAERLIVIIEKIEETPLPHAISLGE